MRVTCIGSCNFDCACLHEQAVQHDQELPTSSNSDKLITWVGSTSPWIIFKIDIYFA